MMKPVESSVRLEENGCAVSVESVADILERQVKPLIQGWLIRVNNETDLASISLSDDERTGHLPHLINDVIGRLRLDAGTKAPISKTAAVLHPSKTRHLI
jgi:hypothetical protein